MSASRFIVGLGSGRCGTASLAALLALQVGVDCLHERKPILSWSHEPKPWQHLETPTNSAVMADVGFYYLPHVPRIIERYGDRVVFVCLKRDQRETEASFLRVASSDWFAGDDGHPWSRSFPSYPELALRPAIERYWLEYYDLAGEYAKQYEQFQIFPTEALNSEAGVRDLLTFAGVVDPVVRQHIHIRHP